MLAILILRLKNPGNLFVRSNKSYHVNTWQPLKINYSSVKIHSESSQSFPQILQRKAERELPPEQQGERTRVDHVRVRVHVWRPRASQASAESDVQWQGGEEELHYGGAARACHHHLADRGRVRVQLQEWQHGGDQ